MTVVTDELLQDLRTTHDECIRETETNNTEYNQGWIDALTYAINHLESFETSV